MIWVNEYLYFSARRYVYRNDSKSNVAIKSSDCEIGRKISNYSDWYPRFPQIHHAWGVDRKAAKLWVYQVVSTISDVYFRILVHNSRLQLPRRKIHSYFLWHVFVHKLTFHHYYLLCWFVSVGCTVKQVEGVWFNIATGRFSLSYSKALMYALRAQKK